MLAYLSVYDFFSLSLYFKKISRRTTVLTYDLPRTKTSSVLLSCKFWPLFLSFREIYRIDFQIVDLVFISIVSKKKIGLSEQNFSLFENESRNVNVNINVNQISILWLKKAFNELRWLMVDLLFYSCHFLQINSGSSG